MIDLLSLEPNLILLAGLLVFLLFKLCYSRDLCVISAFVVHTIKLLILGLIMILRKQSILHSLQVRECQEDSLVARSSKAPGTVGVVWVEGGVIRAGEVARAKQIASAGGC